MKYNIGDLVKYYRDTENTYIVVATKEQPLTIEYLRKDNGKFNIDRFEDFAKAGIRVSNGFDYKILKLLIYQDGIAITDDELIDVFEGDLDRLNLLQTQMNCFLAGITGS